MTEPERADRPAQRHRDATVTRDAAGHGRSRGRRRRAGRRPHRHPPAGGRRRAVRQGGRSLRAVGHDEQPDRPARPDHARRRDLPARQGAHRRKRAGRRGRALGPADAHLRLRRRHPRPRSARALLPPGRRRAPPAHDPGGAWRTRTTTVAASSTRSRRSAAAGVLRPARHDPASRRRPRLQRRRGLGRIAARDRRALRLGERLPVEGAGRAGRLGAARQRARSSAAPGGRASSSAAACARRASSPPAASTRSSTTRAPRRRPPSRRALGRAPGAGARPHGRRGKLQTNMVFVDTTAPACRRPGLSSGSRRRACWPWTKRPGRCASSPTSTSTTRRSKRRARSSPGSSSASRPEASGRPLPPHAATCGRRWRRVRPQGRTPPPSPDRERLCSAASPPAAFARAFGAARPCR